MAIPWRCWLTGHRWSLILDQGHVFLQCAACGSTTPGWWVRTEGTVEIVKPPRDEGPAVDPTYENCSASWHRFHKFDDHDADGRVCCRYCGRPFEACIRMRDEGVLGDV